MDLYKLKLVSITLIFFLAGCTREKDELMLPVNIRLGIGIKSAGYEFPIFGGQIGIQSIRFEGKREAGEDVFFETDPEVNLPLIEFSDHFTDISDFDIPRGVYKHMKWDIDLKKIVTDRIYGYEDADSLNIGLVISGTYDYGYGEEPSNPFVFAIDDTVKFLFETNDKVSYDLSDHKSYAVILLLDPSNAFGSISRDSIQKLETSGAIGHQIILISSNKNEDVYESLLQRIILYAKAI